MDPRSPRRQARGATLTRTRHVLEECPCPRRLILLTLLALLGTLAPARLATATAAGPAVDPPALYFRSGALNVYSFTPQAYLRIDRGDTHLSGAEGPENLRWDVQVLRASMRAATPPPWRTAVSGTPAQNHVLAVAPGQVICVRARQHRLGFDQRVVAAVVRRAGTRRPGDPPQGSGPGGPRRLLPRPPRVDPAARDPHGDRGHPRRRDVRPRLHQAQPGLRRSVVRRTALEDLRPAHHAGRHGLQRELPDRAVPPDEDRGNGRRLAAVPAALRYRRLRRRPALGSAVVPDVVGFSARPALRPGPG
ncbi:hypothetical protein G5V59_03325 [Nocardioides sp. W3-2-3]|uniref:hypothetical protein n=1 Tax=Nocardioides convexus TaxID=2712224 RepID=UPI0024185DDD|nr:hypothetical protein [Nocardioides convexus]NGZ99724.1 hypothetical protein [Nocardioides convexus]